MKSKNNFHPSAYEKEFGLKGKQAEDFIYELAKKSFLVDWCYKNPKTPDGKEICDLLVVYDNIAIIWQIKDLKLDENGKYKKSEVNKNLRQLFGAKRNLFELKRPIELENSRRGKEIFDPSIISKIHLISALLGEGEEYFPFIEVDKKNVIHVFTREFTKIALNELDTIRDFIDYLKEKEKLVSFVKEIKLFGGEKELLAFYLSNERNFEKFKGTDCLIINEGCWEDLCEKPEYLRKKHEDTVSYVWDSIINRAYTCGAGYERTARELARQTRFERRILSKAFLDAHILAHKSEYNNTFRRFLDHEGTTYCFMFLDDPEPRERRKSLLAAFCFIARGIYKDNKKVIGIATEMKIRPICSYDFCLLEIPEWNEKEQKEMERLQKETGICTNISRKSVHEDEYPLK